MVNRSVQEDIRFERLRRRMVEEQLVSRGIRDERVLEAMRKVPRHLFVEEALWDRAYGDHALPIGERQTISQPYMVALMTEALDLKPTDRVLEIGSGSGYQAAVLAELVSKVYSIERIKSLAMKARERLERLRYQNVVIKVFDGTYGWGEEAPFDAVMVTAGAPAIPQPLLDQLCPTGRMAIPIGDRLAQVLHKVVKTPGGYTDTKMTGCVFVSLVGQHGWQDRGSVEE